MTFKKAHCKICGGGGMADALLWGGSGSIIFGSQMRWRLWLYCNGWRIRRRIEVVITRTTRNVVSRVELRTARVLCWSEFAGFLSFIFLSSSKRSSKKNLIGDRLTIVSWDIRRRIEVVITRTTRNRLYREKYRGFESHRLRQIKKGLYKHSPFYFLPHRKTTLFLQSFL